MEHLRFNVTFNGNAGCFKKSFTIAKLFLKHCFEVYNNFDQISHTSNCERKEFLYLTKESMLIESEKHFL
jgi:hypothetical protein